MLIESFSTPCAKPNLLTIKSCDQYRISSTEHGINRKTQFFINQKHTLTFAISAVEH